ncbi:MAG: RND transporter, partial [Aliifodinibius sp.]|nr:RND transporter [Fodinibius sp.]NIY30385.1 RND transporter [Fodinibius sp.]
MLLIVWGFTGSKGDNPSDIIVQPTKGPFQVTVTVTGELQAKNSVEIYGPRGTARMRIYEMKISKLIPEGT